MQMMIVTQQWTYELLEVAAHGVEASAVHEAHAEHRRDAARDIVGLQLSNIITAQHSTARHTSPVRTIASMYSTMVLKTESDCGGISVSSRAVLGASPAASAHNMTGNIVQVFSDDTHSATREISERCITIART